MEMNAKQDVKIHPSEEYMDTLCMLIPVYEHSVIKRRLCIGKRRERRLQNGT